MEQIKTQPLCKIIYYRFGKDLKQKKGEEARKKANNFPNFSV